MLGSGAASSSAGASDHRRYAPVSFAPLSGARRTRVGSTYPPSPPKQTGPRWARSFGGESVCQAPHGYGLSGQSTCLSARLSASQLLGNRALPAEFGYTAVSGGLIQIRHGEPPGDELSQDQQCISIDRLSITPAWSSIYDKEARGHVGILLEISQPRSVHE